MEDREKREQIRQDENGERVIDVSDHEHFNYLAEDPWVDHDVLNAQQPPPLIDGQQTEFLILGAGHGGFMFATRLVEAGITPESIRMVDSTGGFGGTWYWNRYPGLMCDVESSIYMPLLEETGYIPKHRYSYGPELLAHTQRIAKEWHLEDKALFRSVVKSLKWDEGEKEWIATINEYRGPSVGANKLIVRARFVVLSAGILNHPLIPKVPGMENFKPHCFHTARWDYKYTGGSPDDQSLVNLKDKVVGVIGTGATSIQVIPELAKWAKEVYVFQRSPANVDQRDQKEITAEMWKNEIATAKGWQQKRMENFISYLLTTPNDEKNLVDDGWTHAPALGVLVGSEAWGVVGPERVKEHVEMAHALDLPRMERIRKRIERNKKLKPWYPSWCKRPCFHDDYLRTFNKPNVRLIDTAGKGVEAFTETAAVVSGTEYPLDALVLATGYRSPFDGSGSPAHLAKIQVVGRNGSDMDEKWNNGVATLHGVISNGFPNLFFPGLAQAGVNQDLTYVLSTISRHVAHIVTKAKHTAEATGLSRFTIEPTREAEEDWSMRTVKNAWVFAPVAGCPPGTVNIDGAVSSPSTPEEALKKARSGVWPQGALSYARVLEKWRDDGKLDGIKISG
ncbi:flavin-binding monooxygenase-like family protein [Macrophomina phaseolina]|uniref:Flavin-binding monooxygenase-like family protein n=1 Tax=Macrophomina phaseolina TaxID=35725 RepID=A0ABQ8GKM0_9PEZI|nr:flavin-binding monooxygenase-like family protein [Macrophomina phaseolina]